MGVHPSDFLCDVKLSLVAAMVVISNLPSPLVLKGYAAAVSEVIGNLHDLIRADGFRGQLRYLLYKLLLAPVQAPRS